MKTFKIKFQPSCENWNKYNAKIEASNEEEAIEKLEKIVWNEGWGFPFIEKIEVLK